MREELLAAVPRERAPNPGFEPSPLKPPPAAVAEPTGLYINVGALVPPEVAARAVEHFGRGREIAGLFFDLVGKVQTARDEAEKDAAKLRGRRRRRRR